MYRNKRVVGAHERLQFCYQGKICWDTSMLAKALEQATSQGVGHLCSGMGMADARAKLLTNMMVSAESV